MPRYNARKDGNHTEIVQGLQDSGIRCKDIHAFPGMCDVLVQTRSGALKILEIKTGAKEKFTEAEQKLFELFPGNILRVETLQQAIDICFDDD